MSEERRNEVIIYIYIYVYFWYQFSLLSETIKHGVLKISLAGRRENHDDRFACKLLRAGKSR